MNDNRMPPKARNQSYKDLKRNSLIPKLGCSTDQKASYFFRTKDST